MSEERDKCYHKNDKRMKGKRNDKDKTASGMKNTANYITTGRIGLALSLFFVPPLTISFYIVYLLCGLSDMADGFIARKTHTESAFGAKLDSIADFSFIIVVLIRILPVIVIPTWLLLWIGLIMIIKIANILVGCLCRKKLIMLHTIANKMTGFMLFILPLFFGFQNVYITYAAVPVCILATFAALQEGFYIGIKKLS